LTGRRSGPPSEAPAVGPQRPGPPSEAPAREEVRSGGAVFTSAVVVTRSGTTRMMLSLTVDDCTRTSTGVGSGDSLRNF